MALTKREADWVRQVKGTVSLDKLVAVIRTDRKDLNESDALRLAEMVLEKLGIGGGGTEFYS